MPRRSRLVIPRLAHHVTQRGSRRGLVFFKDEDRALYLDLLRFYAAKFATQILGYCLMDNHVHLVLVPSTETGLSATLKVAHMRYASVINGQSCWTGHLWQERFFSAPLDDGYFWVAMRYVELNPVKAGMVARAIDYRWSSARAHSLGINDPILTSDADWKGILEQRTDWAGWLQGEEDDAKVDLLRYRTNRDLPCGDNSFIEDLEKQLGRPVLPGPRGRPRTKEPRK